MLQPQGVTQRGTDTTVQPDRTGRAQHQSSLEGSYLKMAISILYLGLQRGIGAWEVGGGGGLGNYSQVVDIKSMEFHVFKEKKKGLHTTLLPYAALNTNAPMYLILPLLLPQPHYFIETL